LFGGTVHTICILRVFRCEYAFFVKVMDVGKSEIVWSGNNGCHMSQEFAIKLRVALHSHFPNRLGCDGLNCLLHRHSNMETVYFSTQVIHKHV